MKLREINIPSSSSFCKALVREMNTPVEFWMNILHNVQDQNQALPYLYQENNADLHYQKGH